MDDFAYALSSQNTLLILCIVGGVAVAFVLVLIADSFKRKSQSRHGRRSREHSDLNPIRAFRRFRHSLQTLKSELRTRQRHKERLRQRER